MDDRTLVSTWTRLEAFLDAKLPTLATSLRPPADEAAIAALEAHIGRLPNEVRGSYLRHDGQSDAGPRFFFGLPWLRLDEVRSNWEMWQGLVDDDDLNDPKLFTSEPEGAIRLAYARPGWIPLSHDGGGNHLGVDREPGPTGRVGQVVNFGRDEHHKHVLGHDFGHFLAALTRELEAGNYVIDDDEDEPDFALRDPPKKHFLDAAARIATRLRA